MASWPVGGGFRGLLPVPFAVRGVLEGGQGHGQGDLPGLGGVLLDGPGQGVAAGHPVAAHQVQEVLRLALLVLAHQVQPLTATNAAASLSLGRALRARSDATQSWRTASAGRRPTGGGAGRTGCIPG